MIRKIFSIFLSIVLYTVLLGAVFALVFKQTILSPQFLKTFLRQADVERQALAAVPSLLTKQLAQNDLKDQLSADQLQQITTKTFPSGWINNNVGSGIDALFGYFNGASPSLNWTLEFSDVKTNLAAAFKETAPKQPQYQELVRQIPDRFDVGQAVAKNPQTLQSLKTGYRAFNVFTIFLVIVAIVLVGLLFLINRHELATALPAVGYPAIIIGIPALLVIFALRRYTPLIVTEATKNITAPELQTLTGNVISTIIALVAKIVLLYAIVLSAIGAGLLWLAHRLRHTHAVETR